MRRYRSEQGEHSEHYIRSRVDRSIGVYQCRAHMNVASLLKHELARRTAANPAYSMRSLAKSLEISPSQLCEILSGRKNMSERTRLRIAKKLGWSVDRRTSRKKPDEIRQLSWWHLAILELGNNEKTAHDPARIARRLGISSSAAKIALDDLVARGLLKIEDNFLHPVPDRLFFGDGTSSEAIRGFHKETLQLATRQIELTCYEDREYSFSVLALTPATAQSFRQRIREVVEEFSTVANAAEGQKEIFGFSVQLYKISNREKQMEDE